MSSASRRDEEDGKRDPRGGSDCDSGSAALKTIMLVAAGDASMSVSTVNMNMKVTWDDVKYTMMQVAQVTGAGAGTGVGPAWKLKPGMVSGTVADPAVASDSRTGDSSDCDGNSSDSDSDGTGLAGGGTDGCNTDMCVVVSHLGDCAEWVAELCSVAMNTASRHIAKQAKRRMQLAKALGRACGAAAAAADVAVRAGSQAEKAGSSWRVWHSRQGLVEWGRQVRACVCACVRAYAIRTYFERRGDS
jgi:hypothetical protein